MATETELWKIGELRNRAADALSTGYQASANGQVTAVPDARTIRYYGTLGLVDKPAEMRGRTAYYGRRHLLQLVAIKRLQARGLKLSEVQSELQSLANDVLEELAAVPSFAGPARPALAPAPPSSRRESFWNAPPPVLPPTSNPTSVPTRSKPKRTITAATLPVQSQLKMELAPGVHLFVDTNKHPSQADQKALGEAAQALVDALRACGLHEPQTRRDR
jgi:DNA-binding transcriptional MerR regulator